MMRIKGLYDNGELNFEDVDGCRARISHFDDGQTVIRTANPGHIFSGYVTLTKEDTEALIELLSGE